MAKAGVWEYDVELGEMIWTEEIYGMLGLSADSYDPNDIQKSFEFCVPEERPAVKEAFNKAITEGLPYDKEMQLITAQGGLIWTRTVCRPQIHDGKVVKVVGNIIDISELKQMEMELRVSEEKYRSLFENSIVGMYRSMLDGSAIIDCNDTFAEMYGYKKEEIIGKPSTIVWANPDDRKEVVRLLNENSKIVNFEAEFITKNGERKNILLSSRLFPESGIIEGVNSDITERTQANMALRESQNRLASIYNAVADIIFHMAVEPGNQFRFVSVNPAFGKTTGIPAEAVIGKTVNEIGVEFSPNMLRKFQQAIAEHDIVRCEEEADFPAGRLVGEVSVAPVFNDGGECTHLVGIVHDIADYKRLRRQLFESQKMDNMGRLASGVAHDFKNDLVTIKGNIDKAMIDLPEASAARAGLQAARDASERAAKLVGHLLLAGRDKHSEFTPIDLNKISDDLLQNLGLLIGEGYRLVTEFADDLGEIRGDASHLEQVIMNLVVNARDAMPGGGDIAISTTNEPVDDKFVLGKAKSHALNYVRLAVADNGDGMDEETRSHIFEPFFTTKAKGKGTGLGLSVVYGIVSDHGGWIDVESAPGKGSIFNVYLPAVDGKS
ncbi:MAG: PAS domain-containing sensor histidine kinase [Thermoleophilia bacterium]